MKRHWRPGWVTIALAILATGCQPAGDAAPTDRPAEIASPTSAAVVTPSATPAYTDTPAAAPLTVSGLAAGDRIDLSMDGRIATLDVYSERGIGSAEVALAEGPRPAGLVVRLHLRGLEELRFSYGTNTIIASVSSDSGHDIRQTLENSLAMRPAPEPIGPDSPFWLEIAIVGAAAREPFPLKEGYFEVKAPADFLAGEYDRFTLSWVDFFR